MVIIIKWSQIDREVLHTVTSAQQPSFCDHCQNFVHDTKACPFSVPRNIMMTPPVQVQLGSMASDPLAGGLNMLTQGYITRASKYVIILIIVYANGVRIANICMYATVARSLTTHSRLVQLLGLKF